MAEEPLERKSPEAFIDDLRGIVSANVAGNAQLLSRVVALLTNAGHLTTAAAQGRAPDPSAILTQGLELTLESCAIVNQHALAMLNDLVSVAERTLATPPRASTMQGEQPESQPPLRLEGRRGERVIGRFAVENQYDCPVQVSFALSPLTPAQAPPLPATHVALDPVRLVIGPKASLIVEATIDITEEFVVGETYTATIRVLGFQAPDILLQVAVLGPTEQGHPQAPEDGRTRRPPTRKRKAR